MNIIMQHLYYIKRMDIKHLYHLSDNNYDNETFVPRPMPRWRAMEGENWKTKRICVSTSIDGALAALLSSDSQPFGKHLFVHVPENIDELKSKNKIYAPSKKQVPDVEATGELWLKAPAKMKCIGEIEVVDIDASNELSYEDDGQTICLDAFVWKWIWTKDV